MLIHDWCLHGCQFARLTRRWQNLIFQNVAPKDFFHTKSSNTSRPLWLGQKFSDSSLPKRVYSLCLNRYAASVKPQRRNNENADLASGSKIITTHWWCPILGLNSNFTSVKAYLSCCLKIVVYKSIALSKMSPTDNGPTPRRPNGPLKYPCKQHWTVK